MRPPATSRRKKNSKSPTKVSWLVHTLAKIHASYTRHTSQSKFHFENTAAAAKANTDILRSFDWNIQAAVASDKDSIIQPGTEFRQDPHTISLIKCHSNADTIIHNITLGASYPIDLSQYDETDRLSDLHAAMAKGNNKSALHPDSIPALKKAYDKEVSKGWMLPIEASSLPSIPGVGVIPIGCMKQNTVNDKGERISKRRTTHDCSQTLPSGFSVNTAVNKTQLEECIYGYCLLRILHNIHTMRIHYPLTIILMNINLSLYFQH